MSRLGPGHTPVLDLTLRRTLPRDERLRVVDAALVDPSRVRIPPERGASAATIEAFRAVVDPLTDRRAGKLPWRRRPSAGPA